MILAALILFRPLVIKLINKNESHKTLKLSLNADNQEAGSENILQIDTIYSAIQAANDKYESQNIRSKKSKTPTASAESVLKNIKNQKFKWRGRRPK